MQSTQRRRRWVVMNQKGGVGKTTTVVTLGAILAEQGHRVLVVDLDPQANATTWLCQGQDGGQFLLDVLIYGSQLAGGIVRTVVEGLDVVPASPLLVHAEGNADPRRLRAALDELGDDRWDWVLIDCPPSLGVLSATGLSAGEGLLVPVQTQVMPMKGLTQLLQTVQGVQRELNPGLELRGILPVQVDLRASLSRAVVDQLRGTFGELVFRTVVRHSVRVAEAPGHYQPVTVYARMSTGSFDYYVAAREFMEREGMVMPA